MSIDHAKLTIVKANIAAGQQRIADHADAMRPTSEALLELFDTTYAPDYDGICDTLGHEPTLSELGFLLSTLTLTPEQAVRVTKNFGRVAAGVFVFNLGESEQPEDVEEAAAGAV